MQRAVLPGFRRATFQASFRWLQSPFPTPSGAVSGQEPHAYERMLCQGATIAATLSCLLARHSPCRSASRAATRTASSAACRTCGAWWSCCAAAAPSCPNRTSWPRRCAASPTPLVLDRTPCLTDACGPHAHPCLEWGPRLGGRLTPCVRPRPGGPRGPFIKERIAIS
jgi:hypothetical protein